MSTLWLTLAESVKGITVGEGGGEGTAAPPRPNATPMVIKHTPPPLHPLATKRGSPLAMFMESHEPWPSSGGGATHWEDVLKGGKGEAVGEAAAERVMGAAGSYPCGKYSDSVREGMVAGMYASRSENVERG